MPTPAPLSAAKTALVGFVASFAGGATLIAEAVRTLHGAPQAAALVTGGSMIAGAGLKALDTYDKHLATAARLDEEKAKAWVAGNVPFLEQLVTNLSPVAADLPGVPGDIAALRAEVAKLSGAVAGGSGIDVDALAETVKSRIVAGYVNSQGAAAGAAQA